MGNRSGAYRTNLSGDLAYKSFVPAKLPPSPPINLTEGIVDLLVKASSGIAKLEGVSSHIPSAKLPVSMYVRKEALMSSQIEGTQATLEDIFDPSIAKNANLDAMDVVNYVKATEYAIERLETLPLCSRLIKETHSVLMEGVRGEENSPGEFRRSQNWIGAQGSTIRSARYIPPTPEDMEDAMADLEKYINGDDSLNPLIQAALIHYQFETIHPFLDGNGRIGRLLVTLFLMERKVMSAPVLYISYFLKKNRAEYYDRMGEVRENGDYEQWVRFFLEAMAESAEDALKTIGELSSLHDANMAKMGKFGRQGASAKLILSYVEEHPIITIKKAAEDLGLAFNTASSAVMRLVGEGILEKTSNKSRNRAFSYKAYLDILSKGT